MTDLSRGHPISRPAVSTEDDHKEWGPALDRRFKRERELYGMGSGNSFNGSTKFIGWLLVINATLVAAAITGGVKFAVTLSERMATQEAKMDSTNSKVDMIIAGHIK
jgi:hypothetical protein